MTLSPPEELQEAMDRALAGNTFEDYLEDLSDGDLELLGPDGLTILEYEFYEDQE